MWLIDICIHIHGGVVWYLGSFDGSSFVSTLSWCIWKWENIAKVKICWRVALFFRWAVEGGRTTRARDSGWPVVEAAIDVSIDSQRCCAEHASFERVLDTDWSNLILFVFAFAPKSLIYIKRLNRMFLSIFWFFCIRRDILQGETSFASLRVFACFLIFRTLRD